MAAIDEISDLPPGPFHVRSRTPEGIPVVARDGRMVAIIPLTFVPLESERTWGQATIFHDPAGDSIARLVAASREFFSIAAQLGDHPLAESDRLRLRELVYWVRDGIPLPVRHSAPNSGGRA